MMQLGEILLGAYLRADMAAKGQLERLAGVPAARVQTRKPEAGK